eukprot:128588_1
MLHFVSAIFALLISIITINAEYTCPSSLPCTVVCSDLATDCATKIDGTAATSLTVLCNDAATACDTILLPNATVQSSSITCSASSSCNAAEIYYFGDATSSPSNNNIELICTLDDACYNTKIFANDAGNFKLDCDGAECVNLKINVANADNVDLKCKGGSGYYGGCYGSSIGSFLVSAENVTSTVNITCGGYRGCNNLRIDADKAGSVYIHAKPEGLYNGEFITKNIETSLEITCIGNGSGAGCSNTPEFYLPTDLSKFTLNCYGTGCKDITLVKNDGLSAIGNANINF